VTVSTPASRRFRPPKAAEYLGVAESTLAKWRMRGDPPAYRKLGRVVVYDQTDLDAWLDACRRTSTSDIGPANRRHSRRNSSESSETRS
jgi:predicted DNA-binding transcriptional regulator AlpA